MMDINQRKEQFSIAYARAIASAAGVNTSTPEVDDDSIDIEFQVRGIIGGGTKRSPKLDAQLKCTSAAAPTPDQDAYFDLKIKNYNDLRETDLFVPRILIVVFVPESTDQWINIENNNTLLQHSGYWVSLCGQPETQNQRTVRIPISVENVFNQNGITQLMEKLCRGEAIHE